MRTVRDVLAYLLENDAGDWQGNPFLCIRARQLFDRGRIDAKLYRDVTGYIDAKIKGDFTLCGWHIMQGGKPVSVDSDEWPPIRRCYLERWIEGLEIPIGEE